MGQSIQLFLGVPCLQVAPEELAWVGHLRTKVTVNLRVRPYKLPTGGFKTRYYAEVEGFATKLRAEGDNFAECEVVINKAMWAAIAGWTEAVKEVAPVVQKIAEGVERHARTVGDP